MDETRFRNGMNLLAAAFDRGNLAPRQIELRYEGYHRLFAGDDGDLFEAACVAGTQTAWRFFPTPVEIREEMARITEAIEREQQRRHYAALVAEGRRRDAGVWARHLAAAKAQPPLGVSDLKVAEPPPEVKGVEPISGPVIRLADEIARRASRRLDGTSTDDQESGGAPP